jgi:hypothetical protein
MKIYIVYDSIGNKMATLTTLKDALDFKSIRGNKAWTIKPVTSIKNKKSTEKQKAAVKFVEEWLNITFTGNINNFNEVSDFLYEYLDEAKLIYDEVYNEYTSYIWSKY